MTLDVDTFLLEKERAYPELFQALRQAGWHEGRQVDPANVEREPFWPEPFPMHDLARQLLARLSGISRFLSRRTVCFGCENPSTAGLLKRAVRPYDVERFLLGESEPFEGRPPAFPIGILIDEMLFLREDWTTIAVSYNWYRFVRAEDPFAILNAEIMGDKTIYDDPRRSRLIEDVSQVPQHILERVYLRS